MLRSKSRSGSVDIGQKNHYSSVFSRTLSASKLCRGDSVGTQIDAKALKSVDKKPFKVSNLSENRIDRVMSMQQRMGEMEEELRRTKEKLSVTELENYRVLDQLREAKEAVHEANVRVNEAVSPKKAGELMMELENLKNLLVGSRDELKIKDKKINFLELELGKAREIEMTLAGKDASLDNLNKELRDVRERENNMSILLSDNKRRIEELEAEVEREKQSESRMADSLAAESKQLEAAKIELKELHTEVTSLREKIRSLEELSKQNGGEVKGFSGKDCDISSEEVIRSLKLELQIAKESLAQAQEAEKQASLKAKSILDDMEVLKNEWKLAVEAEEKSTKAMEDLALALKEVATEANQAKEKLNMSQIELEHVKREAEQLKEMVRSTEETSQKLLQEARQEAELHKNTADRLRAEAEETLMAWNGKEMGFVSCIKRAEEERTLAQQESSKLAESLKAAEDMTKAAREETNKLRDILKQAVNEANAAKAAAGLARDENSLLKDSLAEKEEAFLFLTRENERLKISEAAAQENVKRLKKLLSTAAAELKTDDKELNGILNLPESVDEEHENKDMKKAFSFNLEDLKFIDEPEDDHEKVLDEDPEKAEALKGSIFDASAETPKSEPRTPKTAFSHRRGYSCALPDGVTFSEDFDHSDSAHDDSDTDRSSHRRPKGMFRRVGDLLLIRRSFHKKEPSITQT